MVSGSWDKTIKVWNLETPGEPRTLTGHQNYVTSVAITADGKTLVSGSKDNTIKVWNLEKGGKTLTLFGHQDAVWSVAITADGKTLVSGSDDKIIKVWNLETLGEPRTLTEHQEFVSGIILGGGGDGIWVSESYRNTIRVWYFDFDSLMRRSCNWVRGYLENPYSDVSESDRHLCDGIGKEK